MLLDTCRFRRPARPRLTSPHRPGFTLLELVIVLGVLGIIAATAFPRIHEITSRQQVTRAAEVAASDVRRAFTAAARARVPVRLTVPPADAGYVVTNTVTGDTILRRNLSAGDLRVESVSLPGSGLEIFPDGVATGPDTLVVGTQEFSRRIAISRVGFVRVLP